jgi:DNA-directed RNA polymerase subunit RPC12/RpoP
MPQKASLLLSFYIYITSFLCHKKTKLFIKLSEVEAMENLKCPQCGSDLVNGEEVCGACGKEVKKDNGALPSEQKKPGSKNIYAILAVLLVIVCGVSLLMYTGLLPNPMKGSAKAAIVNGEKISIAEVDQKLNLYKKMFGKNGQQPVSNTSEGKAAEASMRMQILNRMIQDKILVTEAAKEKITVKPQEIADRIVTIKKSMNFSDKDFEDFLKNHAMTPTNFEKRIKNDLLISKLIAKVTQEKGITPDAWIDEINKKAKVEVFIK